MDNAPDRPYFWRQKRHSKFKVTQREAPPCATMKANTDSQPSNPREIAWEKGFATLKQFKAREKH
jgi:hypothetical protein